MEELRTDEVKVEETGKRDDSEDKFTRRLIFFFNSNTNFLISISLC